MPLGEGIKNIVFSLNAWPQYLQRLLIIFIISLTLRQMLTDSWTTPLFAFPERFLKFCLPFQVVGL